MLYTIETETVIKCFKMDLQYTNVTATVIKFLVNGFTNSMKGLEYKLQ